MKIATLCLYFLLLCLLTALQTGCSPPDVDINYDGTLECANCKMNLVDPAFGTALVTQKGKIYYFDAMECMAPFMREDAAVKNQEISGLWVTDYYRPGRMIAASSAFYLYSAKIESPMAGGVAAFASAAERDKHRAELNDGQPMTWDDIVNKFTRTPK